jgi:hypothetical protein
MLLIFNATMGEWYAQPCDAHIVCMLDAPTMESAQRTMPDALRDALDVLEESARQNAYTVALATRA